MSQNKSAMLFSVALGTFMSALDASVVNIATPVIQDHYGVPLTTVEWVITAYLVVVSSVLLFFGRLSDLYGQRKLYLFGFAVFTAGSGLCGLAVSIAMLIAMRVVQAAGAGMMYATSSAIIANNIPAERRGRAFSVNAIAVSVALSTGPVLGGTLTGLLGWQSVFYINLPVGIVGITLAARFIPKDRRTHSIPIDVPGSVMLFAALFLLLFALDQAGKGMNQALLWPMLAGGIVAVFLFIVFEKRTRHPILNLALFRSRVFSASLAAAVFNYMAQYIMVFLTPFYLQTVRLFEPVTAGLLYIPMPLAALFVAPFAGTMADRSDTRLLSAAGMALMATGLFLLSRLQLDTPLWYIVLSMALTGLGAGLFQTPNNTALMSSAPPDSRGVASGMLATARNVGMGLGVGVSGALFTLFSGQAPSAQSGDAAFIYALHRTFLIACGVALAAMGISLTKGATLHLDKNKKL